MDFIQNVINSGIVGAGGAGFPTHVKLSAKAEYVILNAAECEPLLKVDQQLICIYTTEIIKGLKLVLESVQGKRAYIGIKGKHKEAIKLLNDQIAKEELIELFVLEDFYPAGDEQSLVNEVTKRVVPEGAIPLKVGCIVVNVETALNIYRSVKGEVVTHTYLTITGKVPKPVTLRLPIGITCREALSLAGVSDYRGLALIDGGPMMGKVLRDMETPITKTTKGLIVLEEEHYLIRRKSMRTKLALKQSKAACLQCRMCTDLCPRYLLGHNMQPHLMMRKSNYDSENINNCETAFLCCECALCELYACPAGLSPRLINIHYKQRLNESGKRYSSTKKEFNALDIKEYRKVPVKRLIVKLGLKEYDRPAPFEDISYDPENVKIPLKQHIGAPCIALVEVGQRVTFGEVIGEIPEKALAAKVHASITGIVKEVSSCITIQREVML